MAEIAPFRALRYNPQLVPELAPVVAPPYDVISPTAQERYYARHPFNVVRLILAKDARPGTREPSRYQRAGADFVSWREEGILRRDAEPALYLSEQVFSLGPGQPVRRCGIMAMVRLADYEERLILPHERTFAKYKADRLALMQAAPANLEAIFGFYPGPAEPVGSLLERHMATVPPVEFVDEEGTRQRLWVLHDRDDVRAISVALRDRPIIIADGHHRYETALQFRTERRAAAGPAADAGRRLHEFVLMHLTCAEDPGLVILPTHRLIRQRPGMERAALPRALGRFFHVEARPLDSRNPTLSVRPVLAELAERRRQGTAFAMYAGGAEMLLLTLQDPGVVDDFLREGHSPAYARLDVAILHRLVIDQILGVGPTGVADDAVGYTRDGDQAIQAVTSGEAHLALFQNPPEVSQVEAVARGGERMPQKSTYFYPKLLSGLVISPLDRSETVG
jgi:uncharacterized protein (DUF1015 family)